MQLSRGNRTGRNFTVRVSEPQLRCLEDARREVGGPEKLGPWLLWAALGSARARGTAGPGDRVGSARSSGIARAAAGAGNARPGGRVILDLCGGSGSWSRPYLEAGYDVRLVTLPDNDVRDYSPPNGVHGVLAAPPCNEFSLANRGARDFAGGLEVVTACLRVIALARPVWWALENPGTGLLRRWLGRPRDVWQPADFGDPWTKLTAIWGDFVLPERSPVKPLSRMPGRNAAERAVTPPGFARAFFEANP